MKINVKGSVWIESDERQFILKEYTGKVDKHDTPLYKTLGYYPTLALCLKKYVHMCTLSSEASTISELLQEIRDLRAYIESQVDI